MALLSEVTELLRRWDVWREIEECPSQIDELRKRVEALEAALAVVLAHRALCWGERGQRMLCPNLAMHPLMAVLAMAFRSRR